MNDEKLAAEGPVTLGPSPLFESYETTLHCEGMCYRPERVLTEIFSLESAHFNAGNGISLSTVGDDFYLQEIARTISIISLQCRQQVFSYFLTIKKELGTKKYKALSNGGRINELEKRYPTASVAIKSACGFELCEEKGVIEIPFFFLIKKLCHVEKWSYPMNFNIDETGVVIDEKITGDSHALLIEIANTDSVVGLEDTCKVIINIPEFATASRVLVTECEDCNLPPVANFDIESSENCA